VVVGSVTDVVKDAAVVGEVVEEANDVDKLGDLAVVVCFIVGLNVVF
jgi:hypothetical protein